MTILSFLVWILIVIVWATVDASRNNKGKGILFGNHLAAWIARYVVGFLLVLYASNLGNPAYPDAIYELSCYGAWAWILFDKTYIDVRRLPFDHVGTSSWLDRIFHKFNNPFAAQMIVKAIFLIASTTLFII